MFRKRKSKMSSGEQNTAETVNIRQSKNDIVKTIVEDMIQENDKFLVNARRLSKFVNKKKKSSAADSKISNEEKQKKPSGGKLTASSQKEPEIDLNVTTVPNKLQHLNKGRPRPKRTSNIHNLNHNVKSKDFNSDLFDQNEVAEIENNESSIEPQSNSHKTALPKTTSAQPVIKYIKTTNNILLVLSKNKIHFYDYFVA